MSFMDDIKKKDPKIAEAIDNELIRIREGVELIPSENFPSKAVMQAMGSVFTCKYSEGYPHKRYYGGQEFVDIIEDLAIERAKKLFKADHAILNQIFRHSVKISELDRYYSLYGIQIRFNSNRDFQI